jgi:hypothetical protein
VAAAIAVTAAIAVIAACALLAMRVRVRASIQAAADASGAWSAAAGAAVGPVAFTAGASPRGAAWTAHLLGRRVARGRGVPHGPRAPRVARKMSLARGARLGLAALRPLRLGRLHARVHGAADDPATTARVAGWLAVAAATLAPVARIESDVDWLADAPFVRLECTIDASFVPIRMALALWKAF